MERIQFQSLIAEIVLELKLQVFPYGVSSNHHLSPGSMAAKGTEGCISGIQVTTRLTCQSPYYIDGNSTLRERAK